MEKPKFSLLTIFWLMLTACGFLAGRASTRSQILEAEAAAINSSISAEKNAMRSQEWAGRANGYSDIFEFMQAIGVVQYRNGRLLEVIDNRSFLFEEYDEFGKPLGTYTVELAGLVCPGPEEPFFEDGKKLLSTTLSDFIILLTPPEDADQSPLRSFVVSDFEVGRYESRVLQFQMLDNGFARADENSTVALRILKERETQAKDRRAATMQDRDQPSNEGDP